MHIHFYPRWKKYNFREVDNPYVYMFVWEVRCRCGKEKTKRWSNDGGLLDLR